MVMNVKMKMACKNCKHIFWDKDAVTYACNEGGYTEIGRNALKREHSEANKDKEWYCSAWKQK